jgi:hypothetical protein
MLGEPLTGEGLYITKDDYDSFVQAVIYRRRQGTSDELSLPRMAPAGAIRGPKRERSSAWTT